MENLQIDPSPLTPYVMFDTQTNILELKGRSSPDNSVGFYDKITEYLDQYFGSGQAGNITINVGLEYFNTSSLKCIFQILKKVNDETSKASLDLEINWYYEEDDEDMLETGEDISDLLDIEFNFITDNVGIS
ncbi:MAG: DUF1987 domain-containing protein [Bacteroidota bacterium]